MAVSAILDAKIIFIFPEGSNTFLSSAEDSFPWSGKTENTFPLSFLSKILTSDVI